MNATQSVQQTISSLITNQIIFGTGAGWVQFGPIQATILSSIQQTTALGFFSSVGINCNSPGYVLNANGLTNLSTLKFTNNLNGRKVVLWSADDTAALRGRYHGIEVQGGESRYNVWQNSDKFTFGATSEANVFTEWLCFSNQRVGINCNAPAYPLDVRGLTNMFASTMITNNTVAGQNLTGRDYVAAMLTLGASGTVPGGIDPGIVYGPTIRGVQPTSAFQDNMRLDITTSRGAGDNTQIPRITVFSGTAGGNVGINTSTPSYQLHVNGFSQLSTNRFPATVGRKNILWAATDTAALTGAYYGQEIQSGEFRNTVDVATNRITFGWTDSANTFQEWARFTNQRLGVNPASANPQCTLDIVSSYTASSAGTPGTGTIASFTTYMPGYVAQRAAIDIGAQARTVGNFSGIYKYRLGFLNTTGGGGGDFMIGAQSVAPNTYNLDGTEFTRFYITNTGFTGINTSTPAVTLDVNGTERSISSVTSSITLGLGAGFVRMNALQSVLVSSIQLNSAYGYISSLYVGSTTTATPGYTAWFNGITRAQRLIVGNTSSFTIPVATWDLQMVRGQAAAQPLATTWLVTSDKRIKEDIVNADLDRCYNDLKNVPLRRFAYASSFFELVDGTDRHVLGFLAQEVSSIIPKSVVVGEGYGYNNFNYLNIDQLNMSLYGAVKKTIQDKEFLESTVKGQRIELETLRGTTSLIMSTLEGLQGR